MNRLILAAMASLALTAIASAAPIKIATEGAYPPYNFIDASGKVGGFDVELGNELCKRASLECIWVTNDWDSLVPNLIAGNYDAIAADLTITDERKQTIAFTDSYAPPDASNYASSAGKTFDYSALKGFKIGVQKSTPQADYLAQNLKADNTIQTYDTPELALADLSAGTIDLMLADGAFVDEQVAASNGALKSDGPDIPIGNGAGIGVRKADTDLQDKLNAALAATKADGWLDALIVKYFPNIGPGPYFKK